MPHESVICSSQKVQMVLDFTLYDFLYLGFHRRNCASDLCTKLNCAANFLPFTLPQNKILSFNFC
jgi:hypothetical protein